MALTPTEAVEVRRQTGYPGVAALVDDPLTGVLASLPPEVEAIVRSSFLPKLSQLEADLLNASSTLDTAKAAVWERNAAEVAERTGLYRAKRIDLCRFLGVAPGPGIYDMVVIAPGAGAGTGGGGGSDGGLAFIPDVLVL